MPDWLTLVVLILAAYRLTRLAGWDDFPLAAKIRAWAIGERWIELVAPELPFDDAVREVERPSQFPRPAMQEIGRSAEEALERGPDALGLPGKQPPSEVEGVRPAYDRPTLAHLVHCPFCVGFWISLATVVAWYVWHPVEYGLLPFAVSGAVGLAAKNLDP